MFVSVKLKQLFVHVAIEKVFENIQEMTCECGKNESLSKKLQNVSEAQT